ncbi:hypothetical protein ACFUZA_00215 [Streptomyces cellulosae]|uniref:hypothetical protein n=1 Tax=Streptomyces cellulosae TaxID=1968 RepID=UPI0036C3F004
MSDMTTWELPDITVRDWRLVVATPHGIRVWWHQTRKEPWASGMDDSLSTEARQYALAVFRSLGQNSPPPAVPITADQILPWDAYFGLIELDVATLSEGDPV